MPKQRITKDMVVETAFEIARRGENILVKSIAKELGCSVQPIYCYCENMEGLRQEVILLIGAHLQAFIASNLDHNNMFESTGICHARYAHDEPHLYRMYFLRQRDKVNSFSEMYAGETNPNVAKFIAKERNISLKSARELHLQMMIFNIGISFVLTTMGENTDIAEVSKLLNRAHSAFTKSSENTSDENN